MLATLPLSRLLYWLPRGLALAGAAFIGLFALDVFAAGYSLGEALLGFVIHLAPTWLILGALALSWRRPRLGAGLFAGLAVVFLLWYGLDVFLLLPAPMLVIGLFFLLEARRRA